MVLYWNMSGLIMGEHWIVFNIACTGIGISVIVFLIAIRQSSLLLIDIADTLLYEHSKEDA
jgi:hypothetical protein